MVKFLFQEGLYNLVSRCRTKNNEYSFYIIACIKVPLRNFNRNTVKICYHNKKTDFDIEHFTININLATRYATEMEAKISMDKLVVKNRDNDIKYLMEVFKLDFNEFVVKYNIDQIQVYGQIFQKGLWREKFKYYQIFVNYLIQ